MLVHALPDIALMRYGFTHPNNGSYRFSFTVMIINCLLVATLDQTMRSSGWISTLSKTILLQFVVVVENAHRLHLLCQVYLKARRTGPLWCIYEQVHSGCQISLFAGDILTHSVHGGLWYDHMDNVRT